MKKIYTLFIFTFILFLVLPLNESIASASNDLFISEEYNTKDLNTGKYSSDWSHLDTPENFQLQKDVQNYYSKLKSTNFTSNEQNKLTQLDYEDDLNKRIIIFLSQIDPEIALSYEESSTITPMSSYGLPGLDQISIKKLEGRLHLSVGVLTPSNIAAAIENSNKARDHATQYAKDKNFYKDGVLKTWDNASDTLRHFAWNYMNSNDMGVNKARTVGDVHEVALVALNYLKTDTYSAQFCSWNLSCMEARAVDSAITDWNSSKKSLTTFNRTFDNSSVMDLLNNSKGRQAYQQGYSHYHIPFNIMLNDGSLIQFPTNINSSLRSTAWNSFK